MFSTSEVSDTEMLLSLSPLASVLTLCRGQTNVTLEKLASSGSCFYPVGHRFAQLPHSKVEELGDREGTDNHLSGNASPRGEARRGVTR